MSTLITGATGFVGKNLGAYLREFGFEVTFLNRSDLNRQDVHIPEGTKNIIHLAGLAHDLRGAGDESAYYKVNYELTKSLYRSFLLSNASKFIFLSSVKASADSVTGVLDEMRPASPATPYGKSKLMAEQFIQSQSLPSGKFYYLLRPCMIHGPGNKGNLNLLYKMVRKSIPYPLALFDNRRSFLSIENLSFIIKQILAKEHVPSGVYHVADDESISTNELIRILSTTIGKSPKLWAINKSLIISAAKFGDFLKYGFNTEKLRKLTEDYIVSNDKIKDALQVELPVRAVDGLVKTIQSFEINNT